MSSKDEVFLQTKPDRYEGPFVSVTIHVRNKDSNKIEVNQLRWTIEPLVTKRNHNNLNTNTAI